jgi:hypothetical protein
MKALQGGFMNKAFTVLTILMAVTALIACGSKKTGETAAAVATPAAAQVQKAAPAGTPYGCEKFSLTLAPGWAASPLKIGMVNVLPEGKISPGLYFKFEGEGNAVGTAEGSIEEMIKSYGGSPMESTTIGGLEFKTTTYAYSGMTQTMHVAFRNGSKTTITIEGSNGKEIPEIKAMLASVAWK